VLGTGLAATEAAAPGAELRRLEAAVAPRPAPALELYALHTQISRVDARLAVLRARRDAVEAQLARLRIEVDVAWQSLYAAERVLGARIRQLYEHGQLDPVAILLGAESVDDAVGGLDGLRRLAAGDRDLLEQVTRARDGLVRAKVRVRQRAVALRAAEARAAATAQRLRAAAAERVGYFERLRSQHGYTQRRIARLNAVARAAQRKNGASRYVRLRRRPRRRPRLPSPPAERRSPSSRPGTRFAAGPPPACPPAGASSPSTPT
jgi:peptidoglycan hydrolase CwlO-like protein